MSDQQQLSSQEPHPFFVRLTLLAKKSHGIPMQKHSLPRYKEQASIPGITESLIIKGIVEGLGRDRELSSSSSADPVHPLTQCDLSRHMASL